MSPAGLLHRVTTYYSDSTGTQVAGGRFEGCDGSCHDWGVRTVHKDWSETPVADSHHSPAIWKDDS
ncbi:DUF6289 family protein [Nonomuraea sp. H19]|uniref:DUF6289 family protein n=1 Tax=Nonomuraea sp. H19 TaxID=3452206 RepID=UPI003F89F753